MTSFAPPSPRQPLNRETLIALAQTALAVGEPRYARRVALAWLSAFPGDLPVSLLYAQALLLEGAVTQALPVIGQLCLADPEYLAAAETLTSARRQAGLETALDAAAALLALGGNPRANPHTPAERIPEWAYLLRKARQSFARGDQGQAGALAEQALAANPPTPLAALTHLRILKAQSAALGEAAAGYHQRWPQCLPISLLLAVALIESGKQAEGVSLLHQAVAQDVTGQAARRLWGEDHPFKSLWPRQLSVPANRAASPQSLPIPAGVALALGWNQLPASTGSLPAASIDPLALEGKQLPVSADPSTDSQPAASEPRPAPTARPKAAPGAEPEILRSVRAELEAIAGRLRKPQLAKSDGRYPLYVIFTTRRGLEEHYGAPGFARLDEEMRRLALTVRSSRQMPRWGALVYYADDAEHAAAFGLEPAIHTDPWSLKLALADLDSALAQRGEMIGAVLIVGGPEIVPFHHLPNPVDDADPDVPSDNPYATRDENYFIPEWPVGRLPGGAGRDAEGLARMLRAITEQRQARARRAPRLQRWWDRLLGLVWKRRPRWLLSLGYSAAVWRRVSLAVFRAIGDPRALLVSPPVEAMTLNETAPSRLAYYNLHGVKDASEWFGQRDPAEPGRSGADYPVALRPQDIRNGGSAPDVVFSEACYGAHIAGRGLEESMALKFLASGSQAVIGSTVVSYGSITSPLIAADLLGRAFWSSLAEGATAGEALRRAKVALAGEMHNRQGYLDGEDQKTLISFLLYGDPLAQAPTAGKQAKSVGRALRRPPAVKVICDRPDNAESKSSLAPETMAKVKHIVAQYLPGMDGAQVRWSRERLGCDHEEGHCPAAHMGAKAAPAHAPERQVVTLTQQVEGMSLVHEHIARLTLDEAGTLVKLAVSR